MQKIELFDKYHFVQTPPEKFLEHQYGDWKTPLQTSNKYIDQITKKKINEETKVHMF